MSKVFFYSKFDKVSWGWYRNAESDDNLLDEVESVNRQLKAYAPAKLLLFIGGGNHILLISERNQIDRDNAGRTFSFRQFVFQKEEEFLGKGLLDVLREYFPSENYQLPEVPVLSKGNPQESQSESNLRLIFVQIWNALFEGKRICVVNRGIDEYDRKTIKEITEMDFFTFPFSGAFIGALSVMPGPLFSKISFCLNYEDGFVDLKYSKLANIDIIYTGAKTVVDDSFGRDKVIDFGALKEQGYEIFEMHEGPDTLTKWDSLFNFLSSNVKSEKRQQIDKYYQAWSEGNNTATKNEHIRAYSQIFAINENETETKFDATFIEALLMKIRLAKPIVFSSGFKKNAIQALFNSIPVDHFTSAFGRYNELAREIGQEGEVAGFVNKLLLEKGSLVSILSTIENNAKNKQLLEALWKKFRQLEFEWADLGDKSLETLLKKAKSENKGELSHIPKIWNKLKESSFRSVNPDDADRINLLFDLTQNKFGLGDLIKEKINSGDYAYWAEPFRKFAKYDVGKIELSDDVIIDDITQFINWHKRITIYNELFSDKTNNLIVGKLIAFMDQIPLTLVGLGIINDIKGVLIAQHNAFGIAKFREGLKQRISYIYSNAIAAEHISDKEFRCYLKFISEETFSKEYVSIESIIDKVKNYIDNEVLIKLNALGRALGYSTDAIVKWVFSDQKYTGDPKSIKNKDRDLFGALESNYAEKKVTKIESIESPGLFRRSFDGISGFIKKIFLRKKKADHPKKHKMSIPKGPQPPEGSRSHFLPWQKWALLVVALFLFIWVCPPLQTGYHLFNSNLDAIKVEPPPPDRQPEAPPVTNAIPARANISNFLPDPPIDELIKHGSEYLNKIFLKLDGVDTIDLNNFQDRCKTIPLVQFEFPDNKLTNYKIATVDSLTTDHLWILFARLYYNRLIDIKLDTIYKTNSNGAPKFPCVSKIVVKKI